jgi:hypothetical protein
MNTPNRIVAPFQLRRKTEKEAQNGTRVAQSMNERGVKEGRERCSVESSLTDENERQITQKSENSMFLVKKSGERMEKRVNEGLEDITRVKHENYRKVWGRVGVR